MQVQVNDVGFGYSPYPHDLSRDPGVSLQAKGLFAVYGSFVSVSSPTAWPSEEYLRKLCGGINEKTFRKYKRELLESGWISQLQRHRENGQYTTLLITRYYHPALNPNSPIKSTEDQKTADRKTADRKVVPQEQETVLNNKQKHTQTKTACVSFRELTDREKNCLEWIVAQAKKQGALKNEDGLRIHLRNAALSGSLETGAYDAFLASQEHSKKIGQDVLANVRKWEEEAKMDPVTPSFWEEQKKAHVSLFR
jgi:hypothetical protein